LNDDGFIQVDSRLEGVCDIYENTIVTHQYIKPHLFKSM